MTETAVVIPFRGDWGALLPLLEALARQTVRERLEIILSVDGDESPPDEIRRLTDSVLNGPQAGPAAARNRGWLHTEAPFVLFTDGDCVPEPSWAERMIEVLGGEYQAVKGVYSSGGHELIQRLAQVEFEERYRILGRSESIFLADTYSAGFRRSALAKLGGFDESFPFPDHEDVDLSWRLIRGGGKIGFAPLARVAHSHRKSWVEYFRLKARRGKWRMMLLKQFPERAVTDRYTPQTLKLQILLWAPTALSIAAAGYNVLPALALLTVFLLSCIPLLSAAFRSDPTIAPAVPAFALWRAAALSFGALSGLLDRRLICSRR